MKRLEVADRDGDKENDAPKAKRKRLSLSRKGKFDRFAPPLSEEDLSVAAKGVTTANTSVANDWAVRNLKNWIENRNKVNPNDLVPEKLLTCSDKKILCKWLCCFVQETRKESGERYPASSLRSLLAAFQRILRHNRVAVNIFDKNDLEFADLHMTLDTVCVSLRKDGIGASVKHACVVAVDHEMIMWEKGVLSLGTPQALLRAVFYTVGLFFCLRGGQEHRDLKFSQLVRVPSEGYDPGTHYIYTENGSKNYQGRFSETGQANKVVHAYAHVNSERCPVKVLDFYRSKVRDIPQSTNAFYLQPKVSLPLNLADPWFKNIAVGVNQLKNMMSTISQLAGLPVVYTNHSLRATSTTRMFCSGVPEKVVAEITGHKSVKALRQYEQTNIEQLQLGGKAIANSLLVDTSMADPLDSVMKCSVDTGSIQEKNEDNVKDRPKESTDNVLRELQKQTCFSGSLQNCTINFNF